MVVVVVCGRSGRDFVVDVRRLLVVVVVLGVRRLVVVVVLGVRRLVVVAVVDVRRLLVVVVVLEVRRLVVVAVVDVRRCLVVVVRSRLVVVRSRALSYGMVFELAEGTVFSVL